MGKNKILAINPGSTSTKIAVYDGLEMVYSKNIKHDINELSKFNDIIDQFQFRKDLILKTLKEENIDIASIKIIVGRGGLLRPIESGIYTVNDTMKEDLIKGARSSQHASNLGGLIADDLANSIKAASAFIADPPVVDEPDELARISGHPEFQRKCLPCKQAD